MPAKELSNKLKTLPRSPGVYFHKSKNGEIIYVGKAAVLKNRVRQYFQNNKDFDLKTQALVAEIADTDWIETETEIDALFLESEMVKRYMPRFNILLRDDKSQIYIRINMKDDWPFVSYTRNPLDDGAEYFGPYYNAVPIKKALRYLRKVFPYFTKSPKKDERPSLDAHIGLDPKNITSEEYKKNLRLLISYIKGNRSALIKEFEHHMKIAANEHNYEEAAKYRNRLYNLNELKRRISFSDTESIDLSKDNALVLIKNIFNLPTPPARIEGYDISHMSGSNVVASQVVFTNGASNRQEYRKYKMHVQRNDDYKNMQEVISRRFSGRNKNETKPDLILIDGGKGQLKASGEILAKLGLTIPIVSLAKNDEELVVHNVLSNIDTNNLHELIKEPQRGVSVTLSDNYFVVNLHVGKGNLSSHAKNLDAGVTNSKYLDVVKLFQRIRDESHRFAVSYHTVLKRNQQTKNVLEEIPGIGPKTRQKLIKTLGSVRAIQCSTEEELAGIVGESKAKIIKSQL